MIEKGQQHCENYRNKNNVKGVARKNVGIYIFKENPMYVAFKSKFLCNNENEIENVKGKDDKKKILENCKVLTRKKLNNLIFCEHVIN